MKVKSIFIAHYMPYWPLIGVKYTYINKLALTLKDNDSDKN